MTNADQLKTSLGSTAESSDSSKHRKINIEWIKGLEREYLGKNQDLKEDYQRLSTIPGIGEKAAIALLALFKTYPGTNRAQITALFGLDPVKRESGTSVKYKVKISKNGKGIYRKILYLPTLCATVHHQKIRAFYQRLLANHKPKKLAIIASTRKILLIVHAIYQDKTEYVVA